MSSDSEDEVSCQLVNELQATIQGTFDARVQRPVLKHLNADTSWLLSLPYPIGVKPPPGRCRYNVVIDVWLTGPQIDYFKWFSAQEHAQASNIQSLAQLNEILQQAEKIAIGGSVQMDGDAYFIDAVFCCHEFTDHCHEETLKKLPTHIPIFAPKKAASLVRSWKHFTHVIEIPVQLSRNVQLVERLPDWLSVCRIHTKSDAPPDFHSALVIMFSLDGDKQTEAVIYTPHGIAADTVQNFMLKRADMIVLALLHGLHDVSLVGAQLNMGLENALRMQQLLKVRYWFPTHDEVKIAHGIVAMFLRRISHTLPFAPGGHPITDMSSSQGFPESYGSFVDLGNGGTFVLE